MNLSLGQLQTYRFLFEELVKRDFKKKYKRTSLGMAWSMLMPLCTLGVMYVVFSHIFGRNVPHFAIYLFCGNVLYSWFSESTKLGMQSLVSNVAIFSKVPVPKVLFLLARNAQTLINFSLTLVVFFGFCLLSDVSVTWKYLLLVYPVFTLLMLNVGVGLALASFYFFFRDLDYIWSVFLQLLMYASAIFYSVKMLPEKMQALFAWNPIYAHIAYFRSIAIDGAIPGLTAHLVLLAWGVGAVAVGYLVYRHSDERFMYYV